MFAALLLAFLRIRISVYHQNVQTTGLFPRVLDESTLSCAFLQVPSSPDLLAMQRVVLPPLSAKAAWALTSVFPWRPFISSPGGGPWALFMSAALPASETIICLGAWKVCRQLLTDSCRPWMPAKELTRPASAGPTGHVCEKYLASVPSLSVGVLFWAHLLADLCNSDRLVGSYSRLNQLDTAGSAGKVLLSAARGAVLCYWKGRGSIGSHERI